MPEVLWHLVLLEHCPVGNMTRDPRLAVADDPLADLRPHAVAADQRAPLDAFAGRELHGDAVATLLVGFNGAVVLEGDQIASLAGLEDGTVDVGALGYRVGIVEAVHEALVRQRNA